MTTIASLENEDTPPRLLVSMQGIADLAHVRRPVVSMWRRRFREGLEAFPEPIRGDHPGLMFDASEVAQWLKATGHGNNVDASADAAAAATPAGLMFSDPAHVEELEALVILQIHLGPLKGLSGSALLEAAMQVDPYDLSIRTEVERHVSGENDWTDFADRIIDAAYSPAGALEVITQRSSAAASASGPAAPLSTEAADLLAALVAALPAHTAVIDDGIDAPLGVPLTSASSDDPTIRLGSGTHTRRLRRRMMALGVWVSDSDHRTGVMHVDRLPHQPNDSDVVALTTLDESVLQLGADDVAVIIGPARILTEPLRHRERGIRADALRTDRVRAIVRLPAGLVPGSTREALALWALGPIPADVPVEDRYTAVADLTDTKLTSTRQADLVSDLVACMGTWQQTRARAHRFMSLQRTSSLRVRPGSLVTRTPARPTTSNAQELAAHVKNAALAVDSDRPDVDVIEEQNPTAVPPASLMDLIRERHARLIPGTRISPDDLGPTGLRVILSEHLDNPISIGNVGIDPLVYAAQYPGSQPTQPGDVVFRTGPTTAAWVDHAGASVVAYPARILRIRRADPGGLIPELVAQDMAAQPAGPGAWKRWRLRRVPPASVVMLRRVLGEIAATHARLEERLARLDTYTAALITGITAGAVTLTKSHPDGDTVTAAES
ncbi:hypothetical protein LJR044_002292 [Microbacterium foliorum]